MTGALSPADRERLETLFERAAELPPGEHPAFLERECRSNDALRAELARLLQGLGGTDLLGRIQSVVPSRAGTWAGPYKLLEKVGEGGMGEVYAAEQLEPIVRRVALKVIKLGMDSAEVVARFEAERQALARMSHPNIAQVYHGGATGDGRSYFVMEFVAGEPLTDYCDRRKSSTRARLELFLGVCDGVQHAHQKGIIHRDLKPSNLLVVPQDGRALPKIIDFGIARATTGRLAERTLNTMPGQIVGTLDYMSPEQADPTGVDLDTRSDIYSLGVVLYQLVSGLLPFQHPSVADLPLSEIQRAIREQDPPTPSTRLRRQTGTATSIAPQHGTNERALIRELQGDLDWICMKALEKDPARRYASASELADDVRRHLANEPVLAGRPGALYRARKFVRRHRVGVTAGVLTASGLAAGTFGIVSGRLDARTADQRERLLQPLADELEARQLLEEADALWPPYPDRIPAFGEWLTRASTLVRSLPDHRASLSALEARRPSDSEDRVDRSTRDLLVRLVGELEVLGDGDEGLLGTKATVPGRGWSVPKRLAFAEELAAGFAAGGAYAAAWEDSLPDIRAAYPDLELAPQLGLVPIGRDPDSGRWEFAHLLTGAQAERGPDGRLALTADTGVVLVLIPGGSFTKGAREVPLSAYFLSKYELTQGQWKRLTGMNPSDFGPDGRWEREWLSSWAPASLLHPVEQVSWDECETWLRRADLSLPTEAQWEYGARAGTQTPWWTGPTAADLEGAANVWDRHAWEHGGLPQNVAPAEFDDGSTMHWAVGGSGRANAFGLHDVHGNVFEWCLDGFGETAYADLPGVDPVAPWEGASLHVYRGGSFRTPAGAARSGNRHYYPPGVKAHALGVRPARAVVRPSAP